MRVAAIDIGTNSIHMIVVQIRPDLSFEVIDREKEMVRLGAGGLDGRALTPEAMHAALQVLSKFRRLAESHRVDDVVAVATSAVREAENGGEFLTTVTEQTGIRPRVIRSEEHTSELQSLTNLVCRLLLEKKKKTSNKMTKTTTRRQRRDQR